MDVLVVIPSLLYFQPTRSKHLPPQKSHVFGTEHWKAVPKILTTAHATVAIATKKPNNRSLAVCVRFRMNNASEILEKQALAMYSIEAAYRY